MKKRETPIHHLIIIKYDGNASRKVRFEEEFFKISSNIAVAEKKLLGQSDNEKNKDGNRKHGRFELGDRCQYGVTKCKLIKLGSTGGNKVSKKILGSQKEYHTHSRLALKITSVKFCSC